MTRTTFTSLTYLNTTTEASRESGPLALSFSPVWPYSRTMIKTNNPYEQTLLQKGYSLTEIRETKSTQTRTFPLTMYGRTFQTEAEYLDAIHDFLNGN